MTAVLMPLHRRAASGPGPGEGQAKPAVALHGCAAALAFTAPRRVGTAGGLDGTQLRMPRQRLCHLRQLAQRQAAITCLARPRGKLRQPGLTGGHVAGGRHRDGRQPR